MSKLKKVNAVRYDLTLPGTEQKISYRAFNVGEQKTILQAAEFRDEAALVNAIIDVVDSCVYGADISKLPMHLVDLIFLKIYIKSIGHMANAVYSCGGVIKDEEGQDKPCGNSFNMQIDLSKADLVFPENFQEKRIIKIDEDNYIVLRVPSFEFFKKMNLEETALDAATRFIFSGIESIVQDDNVLTPGIDFDLKDLTDWINDLDSSVLDSINNFFKDIPQLTLKVDVTCPKCGRKEEFSLQGLEDFFV